MSEVALSLAGLEKAYNRGQPGEVVVLKGADLEVAKALAVAAANPDRTVMIGAYSLGKAQRVIALLRAAGYDRPLGLHGALEGINAVYEAAGVDLGPCFKVSDKAGMAGEIVVAPPSALGSTWAVRMPDPLAAMASGWMRVRARARQRGAELPLIVSDHADWDELLRTIVEVGAEEVWVTHGAEEALIHAATDLGMRARALALIGRGESEQESEVSA